MMKRCIFIMISFISSLIISGCATYRELTPLDVIAENNKSIYVDKKVWFWMVPAYFDKWYDILKVKRSIGFKLEDYLKKVGWDVRGYHKASYQKLYKVSNKILIDPYSGSPNYQRWVNVCKRRCRLSFSSEELDNIFKSNYMLTFLIYPNPENLYEYKYDIYVIKLKNPEEIKKVLAEHNGKISFYEMLYNFAEKLKKIEDRSLLFTPKKVIDYSASSIFFDLKKEGML